MVRKKYAKEDINVVWEPGKCIHSGICAANLGQVFNPKERPWIKTENASKTEIVNQVNQCPSGALSIEVRPEY